MDFSGFQAISFDCYGTLINWEAGILPALRGVLSNHGQNLPDSNILELYGEFEGEAEATYQSYRNVLESVVRRFGEHFGFQPSASELRSLHESLPNWPPFDDTVAALQQLHQRYKLAVISNIDDDLFAQTQKLLQVKFDHVITAQQAKSYKPSLNNFKLALERIGVGPDRLLHAAQSVYHDVIPAQSLGIATVWVNRKSARPGVGAVRKAERKPDLEVPDLASLAAAAKAAS
jgi:2-haloacid dehalogenase